MKNILILLYIIPILGLYSCGNTSKKPVETIVESTTQKEWIYNKDININTGDTMYSASLIAEGPFLSGYPRVEPKGIFSIEKCSNKTKLFLSISVGEFINDGKIGVFFDGLKPDLECTYIVKDNQKVILNIQNPEALLKKINMHTFFTLELPIQKQNNKVPFIFMYKENTLEI